MSGPTMSLYLPLDDAHDATLMQIALRRLEVSTEFASSPHKKAALRRLSRRAGQAANSRGSRSGFVVAVYGDVEATAFRLVPINGDQRGTAGYAVIGGAEGQTLDDFAVQVGSLCGAAISRVRPIAHLTEAGLSLFHSSPA